jgi:hypothetical protein
MRRARSIRPRYHPPSSRRQSRVSTRPPNSTHPHSQRTTHIADLCTIQKFSRQSPCSHRFSLRVCASSHALRARFLLGASCVVLFSDSAMSPSCFVFLLLPELQRIRAHTHRADTLHSHAIPLNARCYRCSRAARATCCRSLGWVLFVACTELRCGRAHVHSTSRLNTLTEQFIAPTLLP